MIEIEYNKSCITVSTDVAVYIEGYNIKGKFVSWVSCKSLTAFKDAKARFFHSFKVYTFDEAGTMKDEPETDVKVSRV